VSRVAALALFLALQAGWWAATAGAAHGLPLLGPLIVALLVCLQSRRLAPEERRRQLRAVLGLGLAGTALDSLQAAAGTVRFAGAWVPWLAPLWITALWAHFATALPALARSAAGGTWRLVALGAIGGPMAYWGGVRLGAASFPAGLVVAFATLAVEWAVALPLAIRFATVQAPPAPTAEAAGTT
jgi:hypothetical protein